MAGLLVKIDKYPTMIAVAATTDITDFAVTATGLKMIKIVGTVDQVIDFGISVTEPTNIRTVPITEIVNQNRVEYFIET